MVITRHRGDPNDHSFEEFVTLQSRSSRRRQAPKVEANGYDSSCAEGQDDLIDSSADYGSGLGTRSRTSTRGLSERVMRTRRHVQVENQGTSDSEENDEDYSPSHYYTRKKHSTPMEETYTRSSRRTRRSVQLIPLEEEPTEDEEDLRQEQVERRGKGRPPKSPLQHAEPPIPPRRRSRRSLQIAETTDDTEEDDDGGRMRRRPVRFSPKRSPGRAMLTPSKHVSHDDSGSIRRSTRQKKLLYGTFNQNLIEKHVMLMGEEDEDHDQQDSIIQVRKRKRSTEVEPTPEQDELDMYSRVKRARRQVKRDMYGMPINEDENAEETESSSDTSEEEGDDEDDEGEDAKQGRQYYLRQHKPRTNLYEAPPIQPQKPRGRSIFRSDTPPRSFRSSTYRSPAHRSPRFRRKRPAFHGNSSTSSSSSSDSDDERRFERRKAKSMARNRNRCLPMNFASDELSKGILRDRTKTGSSLADVDPMTVDKNVSFDSVGGLGKHIRSLKEMIVFPLLYPEVFERFKISPPRGVLFYGPPGTGKTLVARALANECSSDQRKVAFFMRKGADCLSKWVGESERQLRLLFDQAYQMRPSIIFFDEIDGLAPVRSSRQDQIHSSIVSTLLALMDGLDNRGEIVVIGATNRLDSIDPALRRPGRFDREFLFPLPSIEARKQILQIHTKEWNPKLCDGFLAELAGNCVGYCGADLKALCTEGALHALRRRYPQIYTSEDKLELDVSTIRVSARDFHKAMQTIVPASQRSVTSPGRALDRIIKPLLMNTFEKILIKVQSVFPLVITTSNSLDAPVSEENSGTTGLQDDLCSDDDDESQPIYEATGRNGRKKRNGHGEGDVNCGPYMNFMQSAAERPFTYRPRLLLAGEPGQGQSTHLGPAILHQLERVPVHTIDLPSLYGISAHTPEEACAQIFREARRTSPSIIYMPHIGHWWDVIHHTLQATFLSLLYDLDPTVPIFLVATSESKYTDLPRQVRSLFTSEDTVTMENPTESERREFFEDLLLNQVKKLPSTKKQAATRVLEILPKAKPEEPRKLTEAELQRVQKQEEKHLRELRIFLRDILNKLGRDRKFGIFAKPVDTDDVPDYYEIITNPMDLSAMMTKIDLHHYQDVKEFVEDINLICTNALEYNPDRDPAGRAIRHRACALRDTCQALIEAELDPDFEKVCAEIKEARKRRGEEGATSVPTFYYTKPIQTSRMGPMSSPSKYPSRFSYRTRGLEAESFDVSTEQDQDKGQDEEEIEHVEDNGPKIRAIVKKVPIHRKHNYNKNKSPWCRSSKKRFRKVIVYVDEFGNEVPPPGGTNGDQEKEDDDKEDIDEQSQSTDTKERKDEQTDDRKAGSDQGETTEDLEAEGNEEKENKPLGNSSSNPSGKPSPKATPTLRSSSRQARSPLPSGGVLTRSTSPRSLSPRTKTSDLPTETPRRPSQSSPRTSFTMEDTISKIQSPSKLQLRRSSRSSAHAGIEVTPMETTPLQLSQSGQKPSPMPNTGAQSETTVPTSSSLPSTRSPQTKSAPSTSASHPPNSSATSSPPNDEKSLPKEASADEEKEQTDKKMSPQVRMTRLRSQVPPAIEAMAKEVLESEAPSKVIVDDDDLRFLLAKAVNITANATVEHLEKLYCRLTQAIFMHRKNIEKTALVQELGQIISNFATNHRSST